MKKTLTAAAIAASLIVPGIALGGTTLYGNLHYSFNSVDEDGAGRDIDGLRGEDNISLFGLKGEYGDAIKAFFHLQTQANADADTQLGGGRAFKQRFYMGGLKGSFGKVAVGRMTNAYKYSGFALDPFYNLSHINASGGFSAGGATYGLSSATNGFTDNALQYVTPSMAGVKLLGGVYVDDGDEDDHGYALGAHYNIEGLELGVTYATTDENAGHTIPGLIDDTDAIRGHATYKMENIKFGLSYENIDAEGSEEVNYLYLTSTMSVPSIKTDFSLSLGFVDETNPVIGAAEGWGVTAGAFYDVTENARLFGIYSMADLDDISAVPGDQDATPQVISLGMQFNFSISSNSM